MSKYKYFILGAIFGCFLVGGIGYAADEFEITVKFPNITYSVGEQEITGEEMTLLYNDVHYAPVRLIADMLNHEVIWSEVDKNIDFNPYETVEFNSVSYEEVNDDMKAWIDRSKNKEMIQIRNIKNDTYVLFTRGLKNSGGYSIEIHDITKKSEGLYFDISWKDPEKGSMVTEEITYPFVLVKLNTSYSNAASFHFMERSGKELPVLQGSTYIQEIVGETSSLLVFEPQIINENIHIHGITDAFDGIIFYTIEDFQGNVLEESALQANKESDGNWVYFNHRFTADDSETVILHLKVFDDDVQGKEEQTTIVLSDFIK